MVGTLAFIAGLGLVAYPGMRFSTNNKISDKIWKNLNIFIAISIWIMLSALSYAVVNLLIQQISTSLVIVQALSGMYMGLCFSIMPTLREKK